MALTYSEMVPLGKKAPFFELPDFDGNSHSLKLLSQGKKATVVMFICVHCPYVVATQDRIALLAREFASKGVQFIAINSNDITQYPDDAPGHMKRQAQSVGFSFPYLVDQAQTVARDYGAVCTPDIFVFDQELILRYRGRIDDNWKEPTKATQHDLKKALEALTSGGAINEDQIPSMGCSIKWKRA